MMLITATLVSIKKALLLPAEEPSLFIIRELAIPCKIPRPSRHICILTDPSARIGRRINTNAPYPPHIFTTLA
jgi:hypothetical protein